MAVKITYFVHGTTIENEQHIAAGCLPGRLSALGIRQAKELGREVAHLSFDVVFSSDLKRAVDTANLAFSDRYTIHQDRRLRECNYGDFEGRTAREFKADMAHFIDVPFSNGESYRDVERRIADFLRFLKQDYEGKHVAIVAHQAPQLALDVLVIGKTWQQAIGEDWRKRKAWQPGWEYVLG